MNQPSRVLLSVLCVCMVILLGCRKDSDNPVNGGKPTPVTITTTLVGVVTGEDGAGMNGAVVSAHGQTATTNSNGLFVMRNVRVPDNRCVVLVRKNGFFTASKAAVPVADGTTHLRLELMNNTPAYSVSAAAGGTVQLSEGGMVQLPAGGIVTKSGQPYSGTVKVAARWLNPVASNFYRVFPGDFAAVRTDGSEAWLYSYGVLNVELSSSDGTPLQIAPGSKARLVWPIPAAMQPSAPAEIPLWYFDETVGMWKEEGKAVKQGEVYTGEVVHFTPWNVDVPMPTAVVEGTVRCNNAPVSDIIVKIGQMEVVTDFDGRYRCVVPADMAIEISVEAEQNDGIGTSAPVTVGPLTADQTFAQDLAVGPCPSYITGTLVDCNNTPTDGIVEIETAQGYSYAMIPASGHFRIRVRSGMAAQLVFRGFSPQSGTSEPVSSQPVLFGDSWDVGTVAACGGETAVPFTEITLRRSSDLVAFSHDASLVAGVGGGSEIQVYNAETGDLLHSLAMGNPQYIEFSADGSLMMAVSAIGAGELWNTTTWTKQASFVLPDRVISSKPLLHPDGTRILFARFAPSTQNPGNNGQWIASYTLATGAVSNLLEITREDGELGQSIQTLLCLRNNATQVVLATEYVTETPTRNYGMRVVVWDMNQGAIVHSNVISDNMSLSFKVVRASDNGNRVVLYDQTSVRIFDVDTGTQVLALDGQLFTKSADYLMMELSPDGSTFIASFADTKARPFGIYSAQTGMLVRPLPIPVESSPVYVDAIQYSPDGRRACGRTLATMQYQRIWHLE